ASEHTCPRCDSRLERGLLPDRDAAVEECPRCGGLWFDADQLAQAVQSGPTRLDLEVPEEEEAPPGEPEAVTDEEAREKARQRLHDITTGLLALPNLFLRSALLLFMLYGMVALVLISLSVCDVLSPGLALGIGVAIAALQFLLGPWVMDLSLRWFYRFSWVRPEQLPEHLHAFVERVCAEKRMKFPSFGLIHDGAPQAFTYGHHPGNARIVISQGIINLLEPEEVEAVVAHEIGHAHNWDMALMTLANLVPLLLYYLYRVALRLNGGRNNKGGGYTVLVGIGAYVLYIVSEYLVLWFSRTREYYADRFSGQVTKNPNALASGLVKIAYGLAAQGPKPKEGKKDAKKGKGKGKEKEEEPAEGLVALRALNIFDRTQAVGLVVASSVGRGTDPRHPHVEHIKSAMQWDLWNPWAKWYELNSTHPLVAKRLLYLADLAAHFDQEPLVVFDRRQPESYWDDFAVDVLVLTLPWWGVLVALGGVFAALATGLGWVGAGGAVAAWAWLVIGGGLVLSGLGQLVRTNFSYRRDFFPHLSVAALMHRVKVSAVRPVPATLTGTVIGKGVPGLVWSKDFVMQDATGILFLDYQQPLAIWNFLFGLLRAGTYQGKEVRVSGWFRRAPVPYLEVNRIETLDDSLPPRNCYSLHARIGVGLALLVAGVALAAWPLFM
ncbi:MAG TPA: M48 family metalloprotease, partial [Gemmataceae bacterium]|nr:M48 family metalloprotease [Gemmataceae bacterium]